eukprot:snap_masked-scaffold_27-processed-gene-0.12-mRNA-1 protein AED:0.00 eAED:0.00 QI:0/-1/0/1/-1/1/1/0/1234
MKTNPSSFNEGIPSDAEEIRNRLRSLVSCHVDSMNHTMDIQLPQAVKGIRPVEIVLDKFLEDEETHKKFSIQVKIESIRYGKPTVGSGFEKFSKFDKLLYPSYCRLARVSYKTPMTAEISIRLPSLTDPGTFIEHTFEKTLGDIPVMVGSNLCNIENSKSSARFLVSKKEDAFEVGGYFIVNGNERAIRLLQMPLAHYFQAIQRNSYKKRGPEFTDKAVSIRCVGVGSNTLVSRTLNLHNKKDGTMVLRVLLRKTEFFVPVMLILKALRTPMCTDKEIFSFLMRGFPPEVQTRISVNLRATAALGCFSAKQCRKHLGQIFRPVLPFASDNDSDELLGRLFLEKFLFIHIDEKNDLAKFELLIEMIRKLLSFVLGRTIEDNQDSLNNHELMTPGYIFGSMLRERLEQYLYGVRGLLFMEVRNQKSRANFIKQSIDAGFLKTILDKQPDIGKKLLLFLGTGNLVSETNIDMMQVAGYTILAEKLNRFRFLSHFRAVHRGQSFTEMRTTTVRKLLPESWGFLCPVHTPDGSPCGLLNHMATQSTVITHSYEGSGYKKRVHQLISTLAKLGVSITASQGGSITSVELSGSENLFPVMLDGVVVGYCDQQTAEDVVVPAVRYMKSQITNQEYIVSQNSGKKYLPYVDPVFLLKRAEIENPSGGVFPIHTDICFIRPSTFAKGCYPGLYIFTRINRLTRPVVNLKYNKIELISPLSQTFMNIAVNLNDVAKVKTEEKEAEFYTHCELYDSSMLSLIASLTPFSDFNQSPRNMYQCQMGKQTMGTPMHNFKYRFDNKIYRINTPQAPICQNNNQSNFALDEHPQGTNSIVAVISYTGYDMEDACIINKASIERGYKHGTMYKTYVINLQDKLHQFFSNVKTDGKHVRLFYNNLDPYGLPEIGSKLGFMDAVCCRIDAVTGKIIAEKHKSSEIGIVDSVLLFGDRQASKEATAKKYTGTSKVTKNLVYACNASKAIIKVRYNRNPIVGDKFASRAGQKGVLSVAWPQEDMPFTETGMTPDFLINPHAMPSRMTIGMLLESMAGKAGALNGEFQDSTPFRNHETVDQKNMVEYFGKQLEEKGFNFYGAEKMYSGFLGTALEVNIYIGVVYYQRLRHMVSDKSQVRATGPIDGVTRQPVKGRKRMGGVRFGEMERDSLLSHGTQFLTQDRLLNSSDRHVAYICCGTFLGTVGTRKVSITGEPLAEVKCRLCGSTSNFKCVVIPFVFRYLVTELAAMGIKWDICL